MNLPVDAPQHITDTSLTSEESACLAFCQILYPEAPHKLYDWFANHTERFTFGIGDNRPTPVGKRKEGSDILYLMIGVETGRAPYTDLPIHQRRRIELDLSTL